MSQIVESDLPARVGILPYELRHEKSLSSITLNQLIWPKQTSECVFSDQDKVSDLSPNDYIIVYPSSTRLIRPFGKLKCKVVLMMAEPLAIQLRYYRLIWLFRKKFSYVLCRYRRYSKPYTNVIQFPVVESWVHGNSIQLPIVKTHLCSIIASAKKDLEGHLFRHRMVDWLNAKKIAEVDVLGRGYNPFEDKKDGLLCYKYSIVIENVREPDYFTEKLLDCFLCGTIPIYWGAPNIGDYFDLKGIIVCETKEQVQKIIEVLLLGNACESSHIDTSAIEKNRLKALGYANLPARVAGFFNNKMTQSI